jgi:hypothetical protein
MKMLNWSRSCNEIAKLDGTQPISCLELLYPIGRFLNAWMSLIGTIFVHHQMIEYLLIVWEKLGLFYDLTELFSRLNM